MVAGWCSGQAPELQSTGSHCPLAWVPSLSELGPEFCSSNPSAGFHSACGNSWLQKTVEIPWWRVRGFSKRYPECQSHRHLCRAQVHLPFLISVCQEWNGGWRRYLSPGGELQAWALFHFPREFSVFVNGFYFLLNIHLTPPPPPRNCFPAIVSVEYFFTCFCIYSCIFICLHIHLYSLLYIFHTCAYFYVFTQRVCLHYKNEINTLCFKSLFSPLSDIPYTLSHVSGWYLWF